MYFRFMHDLREDRRGGPKRNWENKGYMEPKPQNLMTKNMWCEGVYLVLGDFGASILDLSPTL